MDIPESTGSCLDYMVSVLLEDYVGFGGVALLSQACCRVLAAMVRLAIRFIMAIMGRVIRGTGSRVEWCVEPSGEPDFWCGASFGSTHRRLDAGVVYWPSTTQEQFQPSKQMVKYLVGVVLLSPHPGVDSNSACLRRFSPPPTNRNGGVGNQSVVVLSLTATALEQHSPLTCALRTMMNHDWCSQERERDKLVQMAQAAKEA